MVHRAIENEVRLFALLERGSATSREIQDALGLSQPTVSRLTNSLAGRVLRLGRGRSTRYALPRDVRGRGHDFPICRVTETGDVTPLGNLLALKRDEYWWGPIEAGGELFDHLPWFVQDLRPSGFMGRAFAHRHGEQLGLPGRLQDWNDEHVLIALSARGEDLMGNLIVGEESLGRYLEEARHPQDAIRAEERTEAYPRLVAEALAGEPAGSSAAGEQPKFAALIEEAGDLRHVLVKFSPPTDTVSGRRWADLLVCEHQALELIRRRHVAAAESQLVEAGGRYLLEAIRFDRQGRLGRLPLLSLMAVDLEFFGQLDDWVSAANRLEDRGMLSPEDAGHLRWLSVFGSLIANTDQHFGNISLIMVDGGRRFTLAPAYDMVPMLYKPQEERVPARVFDPQGRVKARVIDQWEDALAWATIFWETAAGDARISEGFREICGENARLLNGMAGGPRFLFTPD